MTFFNLQRPIFSFEFSLFEIGNTNTYIAAFIESGGFEKDIDKEYGNTTTIIKFELKNFNSNDYRTLFEPKILYDSYNGRVVSAFRLEESNLIVLLYIRRNPDKAKGHYIVKIYNTELIDQSKDFTIYHDVVNLWIGFGIFVKGISIKGDYAAFALFYDGNSKNSLYFLFAKYNSGGTIFDKLSEIRFDSYSFRQDVYSNGLYKLEDDRIVLFTTSDSDTVDYGELHMFLFDFYNNYAGAKIREYIFYYPGKRFAKEMDASMYNGYILFTATLSDSTEDNTFAAMMIFGFGNGTDFTTDISPYLMDTGYYSTEINLYDFLMSKMTIDNNIFNYEKVEKIRLISICPELLLYKGTLNVDKEINTLPLNELFDANHTLLQNRLIQKKEDQLYTLEYQYMVKEPDFDSFYNSAHKVKDDILKRVNAKNYYKPKTLNGRVNILSFKLCHKYCIECVEYGKNDNDQRCQNCKDAYTYDYFIATNNFTGNCVPQNQMYDAERKQLKNCNTSPYKFYYNTSRNKAKYCFKYDYKCPKEYHYFNQSSNECLDYTPLPTEEPETEKPTQKPTEKPNEKPTEKPTNKETEIITEIILEHNCSIESILNETCGNLTNQELYKDIKEYVLSRFPPNGKSVIYSGKKGYNFQVTNSKNEIESLNSKDKTDLTIIDLGDCEDLLRNTSNITGDLPLIIYKFYKDEELASKKEMQFEVYDPYTYKKLNLSVCDNINLYIPVKLGEDPKIYQNILDQGYDPFDINDKFYREICTQYESENGTDVLLDAREEYYYYPIVNETSCQGNCHYSAYSLDTKYLICECDVNNDGIVTLDVKHFDEKNVAFSFYSSLKLSNYKVVICYNLVFNYKVFKKNAGSIISTVFLGAYVATMILYALRTINPLKVEISRFLFETGDLENVSPVNNNNITNKRHKDKRSTKKNKTKKNKNKNDDNNKDNNKALPPKRVDTNTKNKEPKKTKVSSNSESTNLNNAKSKSKTIRLVNSKNSDIIVNSKYSNDMILRSQEKTLISKTKKIDKKEKKEKDKKEENNEEEILDPELLDDYEFNNLEYEQACEYDRRTFCRTYISVLMREELVLFTFFKCKDYNLFYVKLARFFILALTSMAFNALFFFHKTMYKKEDIEENWTFVQKLPQLLFVLIANHIIEVYLCYLSMTDSAIYEIKALSKKPNNGKNVIDIIDCMKTKLIVFFISTFILFLGFWYFISAFCAVYKNTQIIFIRDSALSFISSLLDPFIISGFTMILRSISLSMCCRKKAKCLYRTSDIIPIF